MPLYCRVDITTGIRETDPAPLPQAFVGLAQDGPGSIADLSWTAPNFGSSLVGKGYWRVVEMRVMLLPGQRYADPVYTVNAGPKTVTATYAAEADPTTLPLVVAAQAKIDTDVRVRRTAKELFNAGEGLKAIALLNDKELLT